MCKRASHIIQMASELVIKGLWTKPHYLGTGLRVICIIPHNAYRAILHFINVHQQVKLGVSDDVINRDIVQIGANC